MQRGRGRGGRGAPSGLGSGKAGDIVEQFGMKLIAVQQGDGLFWKPLEDGDQQKPTPDDPNEWLRQKELEIQKLRISESKQTAAAKRHEATAIPGSSGPHRRGGSRAPSVPEPEELVNLRREAEQARKVKMDVNNPRAFQVIAEALAAAEQAYAAKVEAAKTQVYANRRKRLGGIDRRRRGDDDDDDDDDVDDDVRLQMGALAVGTRVSLTSPPALLARPPPVIC